MTNKLSNSDIADLMTKDPDIEDVADLDLKLRRISKLYKADDLFKLDRERTFIVNQLTDLHVKYKQPYVVINQKDKVAEEQGNKWINGEAKKMYDHLSELLANRVQLTALIRLAIDMNYLKDDR